MATIQEGTMCRQHSEDKAGKIMDEVINKTYQYVKNLLRYTSKLKHLPRTGWLKKGIDTPETVASHSWQMAMMALKLAEIEEKYDFNKVIKLCLCHDLGESVIGDMTPSDKNYTNKKELEEKAVDEISKECDFNTLKDLFREYEANQTPEANLANDLDKLDMYAQSLDYEAKYPDKDLSEFRLSATSAIKTDLGRRILETLK